MGNVLFHLPALDLRTSHLTAAGACFPSIWVKFFFSLHTLTPFVEVAVCDTRYIVRDVILLVRNVQEYWIMNRNRLLRRYLVLADSNSFWASSYNRKSNAVWYEVHTRIRTCTGKRSRVNPTRSWASFWIARLLRYLGGGLWIRGSSQAGSLVMSS